MGVVLLDEFQEGSLKQDQGNRVTHQINSFMDWIKIIGYIAAAATTIAFFPQALHTIKTKDTKAISLGMYIVFTFGVVMWLLYGIFSKNMPIILANTITLVLALIILGYKIRYK